MRLLLLILACSLITLGESRNAYSQSPRAAAGLDRDFQRWLPLPATGQGNVSEQVKMLELLSSQLASAPAPAPLGQLPLPELTNAQLRELDKAYKAWTEQSGGAPLPDLNNIPKEWVDKALANPEQLREAQRLFEQYAKKRNLPVPGPLSGQLSGLPRGLKAGTQQPPADSSGSSSSQTASPETANSETVSTEAASSERATAESLKSSSSESETSESETSAADTRRPPLSSDSPSGDSADAEAAGAASSRARSQAPSRQATARTAPGQRGADAGSSSDSSRASRPDQDEPDQGEPDQGELESSERSPSQPSEPSASEPRPSTQAADAQRLLRMAERLEQADRSETTRRPDDGQRAPGGDGRGDAATGSRKQADARSDAARLKALRELLEKFKTIQASRKTGEVAGESSPNARGPGSAAHSASDPRNNAAAQKAALSEQAGTLSRPASGSAAASGPAERQRAPTDKPVPSMAAGHPPGSVAQPANVREQGAAPAGEEPVLGLEDYPAVENAQALSAGGFAQPSGNVNVAGGNAQENQAFDFSRMFQSTPGAPDYSHANASEALRSAARRSATERSSSEDARSRNSADFRTAGTPPLSSASFEIPKMPAGMSAGLPSGASQSDLQARIKRDIDRLGWEKALRRILETTFHEEPSAAKRSRTAGTNEANLTSGRAELRHQPPPTLGVDPTGARRSTDSLANSAYASVIADVWKAIATAPPPDNTAATESPPASSSSDLEGRRKWSWTGGLQPTGTQVRIALLLIGAVALAVWVGKKRLVIARTEPFIDTRWAKETLSEGIRTRADVIRAFHRFVSHTAEPVASWWTHRYATRRLVEATPQLSAAMSDLSSVYEQARYMPPEAELSADQIRRVYAALQQCAAYDHSAASAPA